jgi:hypothetical protein
MGVGEVALRPSARASSRGRWLGRSVGRSGRAFVSRRGARRIAACRTGGSCLRAHDPRAAELTGMRCRGDLRVAAVI